MNSIDITIAGADTALREKRCSAEELTQSCLDRITAVDTDIHAFVQVTPEEALTQARESDKRIAKGKRLGPLDGVPVALKDIFCKKDTPTTACSKILKGFTPPYDATSVGLLRKQGAVFIGMTNMDEFACGASTEHSCYGPTHNPWDRAKVAGGSSGGSAAAVAVGESIYALGTDTGGSTRQPATLCGVVSIRVTYGLISRFGVMSMASSWDTINPITKDVTDLALVLNALTGKDMRDSTSLKRTVHDYTKALKTDVSGMKFGVPKEYFGEGVTTEVADTVHAAIDVLKKAGAYVQEVSLPMTKYAVACYYVAMPSELSANLARYDGLRFGPGPHDPSGNLSEYYYASRSEGFGDEIKRRIMIGTYALSAGYYDAFYLKAQKVRTLISRDFDSVFSHVDALLCPTSPYPAFGIGEKTDDPLSMYLADALTIPPCAAGIPAVVVPCGFSADGLPIGLQIIGPQRSEERLLQIAYTYEQSTDWHTKHPSL